MITINKIFSTLILLITIIPVFILPVFGIDYITYGIFSFILVIFTIIINKFSQELFSTILFFTLVHLSKPLNDWFTGSLGINFPGTYYLIPILIFTIILFSFSKIRKSVGWWTKDKIDKKSVLLIAGLSILSGLALYIWGKYIAVDMQMFKNKLPDVSFFMIIMNGVGFAIFNSIAEEYLSRGMLINGLEKLFSNKWLIIIIQGIIFSIFHYYGFPGGVIGIIMVFFWSFVLGIIRCRTKGLGGVLIGHFFADLTIFFILYSI